MSALASVVTRRRFLQASLSASGALVLVPGCTRAADGTAAPENPLGILIRIEPDNRVVIGAIGVSTGSAVYMQPTTPQSAVVCVPSFASCSRL